MPESKKDRALRLVREMLKHTVGHGCTPGEAAKFAAKAAELIEQYQISEAELHQGEAATSDRIEVCQAFIHTEKKVFNLGMSAVVGGLAKGMCCECILMHECGEAVYGIVGDKLDADFVHSVASSVVPALTIMAKLEGAEHGYERAGLVRWTNQYLIGAGQEVRLRLEKDRKDRSDAKEMALGVGTRTLPEGSTALVIVTGETLAVAKRAATAKEFKKLYPHVQTTYSKSNYDHTAQRLGREAGKRVGLNVQIGDKPEEAK